MELKPPILNKVRTRALLIECLETNRSMVKKRITTGLVVNNENI